jgi:hypothetical protein
MTLTEKFENIIFNYIRKQYERERIATLLRVDAEEFAIDFTEWCDDNYFRMGNTNIWSDSTDWEDNIKFTTKELLEIFKEENYAKI